MQLNIIMKKTVFQKRNHLFLHVAKKTPSTETQRHKQNLFEEIQRQNKENQKRVLRTCNKQVFFFLKKSIKAQEQKTVFWNQTNTKCQIEKVMKRAKKMKKRISYYHLGGGSESHMYHNCMYDEKLAKIM